MSRSRGTVDLPRDLEPLLERVEQLIGSCFETRLDMPSRGTIEILGERYVLVRAASFSVEFFALIRDLYGEGREAEADDFSRNILFDLAHAIGRADARWLTERLGLTEHDECVLAGPAYFAHLGWARVRLFDHPDAGGRDLVFDHSYSFEADAWLRLGKTSSFPVCVMNAGYAAGWSTACYDEHLVATEIACRANGAETCRFVLATPDRIEAAVARHAENPPRIPHRFDEEQASDLFSRKRIEDALRRSREELESRVAQRTAALRYANEALTQEIAIRKQVEKKVVHTQKLEALGRLAAGIAHDFNNLMGVVVGHASMLERRFADDGAIAGQMREIRQAGEDAALLTRQLLAFSRSEALKRELVDPNAVVEEMAGMIARLLGDEIELATHVHDPVGYVLADRGQLGQVIMNLAVNGRDAMPRGGVLTIETSQEELAGDEATTLGLAPGQYIRISVRDTGVGMDEDTLEKAFEPFFTTKPHGEGTGLGLSTAYGIVTQAGGTIVVDTAPGEGADFKAYLPLAADEIGAVSIAPKDSEPPRGTETILLVEDQAVTRRMIARALHGLGYRVVEAANADEATTMLEDPEVEIDLLLTDIVMPRVSGRELAKRARSLRPGLRVSFMSGHLDETSMRFGTPSPREVFIPKPFSIDVLASQLRVALDRPSVSPSEPPTGERE